MNRLLSLCLVAFCLLFSGSDVQARKKNSIDNTLRSYATAVRWNEWELAMEHLSPSVLIDKPITELERERLNQIRVTGYDEITRRPISKTAVDVLVEIRLVNVHSQTERTIRNVQRWEYDAKLKRWWLVSGLPDFSPKT
jgi:hypothetical protein